MIFFEVLGIFVVAAMAFLMASFLIGAVFTYDNADDEWRLYAGAWISGSVIYALTVVGLVYILRYGGSL